MRDALRVGQRHRLRVQCDAAVACARALGGVGDVKAVEQRGRGDRVALRVLALRPAHAPHPRLRLCGRVDHARWRVDRCSPHCEREGAPAQLETAGVPHPQHRGASAARGVRHRVAAIAAIVDHGRDRRQRAVLHLLLPVVRELHAPPLAALADQVAALVVGPDLELRLVSRHAEEGTVPNRLAPRQAEGARPHAEAQRAAAHRLAMEPASHLVRACARHNEGANESAVRHRLHSALKLFRGEGPRAAAARHHRAR